MCVYYTIPNFCNGIVQKWFHWLHPHKINIFDSYSKKLHKVTRVKIGYDGGKICGKKKFLRK